MKAIYAEPMTKVMMLNVNAAICSDTIDDQSAQGDPEPKPGDEPLF